MRYSDRREAVRRAVQSVRCHPSAEWVYDRVRAEILNISLGTVYRNLRLLAERGEIQTLETTDGALRFDGDLSPHAHFICRQCGRIIDCREPFSVSAQVQAEGYRVDCVKTVMYGICPDCLQSGSEK